jgi:hypothetical protein
MSFSPQILQQVQDSVAPSPILVIPIKPVVTDTNSAKEKTTAKTKKENQSVKNTAPKNTTEKNIAKTQPPVEIKKDTVTAVTPSDTLANLAENDTTSNFIADSVSGFSETIIKDTLVPVQYRTSLFAGHELQSNYIEPKEREQKSNDWILGTILLITLLLLLNKVLNPRKWSQQLKIIFSGRAFEQQLRDEKDFRSPFLFLQFIASSLTITLFIYQLFYNKAINYTEESEYYLYLKILLAVIGLLIIYFISQKIAGFIVEKGKVVSEYLLSTLLLFNITGTLLLPLSIGLEYAHDIPTNIILNTGIAFLGFAFLFKLYKGLTIASSYNSLHLFYLFLYICTLEILPVAIAVKFISENL